MSTFSGFFDEIQNVSVDRFTKANFQSRAFLLSHCHTDHMIGLNEITSDNELPGPLYLSEISQVIVNRRYPAIRNLVVLKVGEPTPISFNSSNDDSTDEKSIERTSVTAIPAGHCPGSVMFLLEQGDRRILYTGDFRLYKSDIEQIIALKRCHEKIDIDCVYLDSTFFLNEYKMFPTQRDSINAIIKLTEDWLDAHPKNVVVLRPPAAYGYEFLLTQLAQYFHVKIHVSKITFKDYMFIPDFDSYISNNRLHCGRIHLCGSEEGNNKWQIRKSKCLPKLDEKHIRIIRPTAMKWRNLKKNDTIHSAHDEIDNVYFVCYSNHSSYDEIKFLIQYIQPKSVKLNVVPKTICQRNEMYKLLDTIIDDYRKKPNTIEGKVNELPPQNYDIVRITSVSVKRSMSLARDEIPTVKIKKRKQL